MNINRPKNDAKYHWTNHVQGKMLYYGLSADRIKRVMRNPHRSEKGIAPETIAVMQPGKTLAGKPGKVAPRSARDKSLPWREEIWVMYATKKKVKGGPNLIGPKKIVITAWRYPGVSKVREAIPIPNDILEELKSIKY